MSETATGASGAWSYRPGDWFAVFGANATVLLPTSQKDQVVSLWALVDGGAGFDEVLDGLLASGLSRIPGFVLVSSDDGPTRVLLRGQGVTATLVTDGETVDLDGAASHTWVERSVDHVTALSVTLPVEGEDVAEGDLPIVTGLVRVSRVDRPAVAAPTSAAPAPAVEPAAEEPSGQLDAPVVVPVAEEPAVKAADEPAQDP
ncbi:hypothetical protein, partial [Nocardioides sp. J9]|uniref:hypothetical protein n=1 Tax=Nocardioides sp. J9 TaxID=935844 RepID=UPI001C9561B6